MTSADCCFDAYSSRSTTSSRSLRLAQIGILIVVLLLPSSLSTVPGALGYHSSGGSPAAGTHATTKLPNAPEPTGSTTANPTPSANRGGSGPNPLLGGVGAWTSLSPTDALGGMVDDPADGGILYVGGCCSAGSAVVSTWVYASGVWTQLHPSTAPSARSHFALAYDPTNAATLLYGGLSTGGSDLGDAWMFSGGQWSQICNPCVPGARAAAALAFDPIGVFLLFGGFTAGVGSALNDTWNFSLTADVWQHQPNATGPDFPAVMAFDANPSDNYPVLFSEINSQTWGFSGGNWTSVASGGPSNRQGAALAFDPSASAALLFGGSSGAVAQNDTWSYAHGSWSSVSLSPSPPARQDAALAYDSATGTLALSGGDNPSAPATVFTDIWVLRPGTWTPGFPSPRCCGAFVADPSDGYDLLFGGRSATGPLGDTWYLQNGLWTRISAPGAPTARWGASIAYDAADGYVVLFGGSPSQGVLLGDTFTYSHGVWSRLSPSVAPLPRIDASMSYDAADGYVVLFGGTAVYGFQNDTWKFLHGSWTPFTEAAAPDQRASTSMAYDTTDGYVVLFGGIGGTVHGRLFNDTWGFSNGTWSRLSPPAGPPPRDSAGIAYSARAGGLILFGGTDGPGSYLSDTWGFLQGTWMRLSTTVFPPARSDLMIDAVPSTGGLVLTDGSNAVRPVQDLWSWDYTGSLALPLVVADPSPAHIGHSVRLVAYASGGTGGNSFSWKGLPVGCPTLSQAFLVCTPVVPFNYTITATVTDTNHNSATGPPLHLAVMNAADNLTVSNITAVPPAIDVGQTTHLNATATGGFGWIQYSWQNLPTGCASANASSITCTPTVANTFPVRLLAQDQSGNFASSRSYALVVSDDPIAPIVKPDVPSTDVGQYVNFTAHLSGGTPPFTLLWLGLPTGCVSQNLTVLTCVPTGPGTFHIAVNETDSTGFHVQSSPLLYIVNNPFVLSPLTASRYAADVGQSVVFTVVRSGGNGSVNITWHGLPRQCPSVNSTTLTCVPPNAAILSVFVKGVDSNGVRVTSPTVNVSVSDLPFILSVTPGAPGFDLGRTGSIRVNYSDSAGGGSLVAKGFPGTCSSLAPPATLFNCTANRLGTFLVTISLNDSNGVVNVSTPISVVVRLPVAIVSFQPSATTVPAGGTVVFSVVTKDGTAPLTYIYVGLPPNCPSASTGNLTCTPGGDGTFKVQVTVSDAAGLGANASTQLVVNGTSSGSASLSHLRLYTLVFVGPILALVAILSVIVLIRRAGRRGGPPRMGPSRLTPVTTSPRAPAPAPEVLDRLSDRPGEVPSGVSEEPPQSGLE